MKSKEYIRCINCEYNEACFLQSVASDLTGCSGHSLSKERGKVGKITIIDNSKNERKAASDD